MKNDLIEINKYVIYSKTKIPQDTQYGTRYNKLRDSIHCSLFENYIAEQETDTFGKVQNCIIIVCDNMKLSKTGECVLKEYW